jgi:predicted RNA binding protein YcfA (HicA-like mRNA interferase family)
VGQLNNISGKEALKAFEKAGWRFRGQVGSHAVLTKEGERANLSIPQHKELSVGDPSRFDKKLRNNCS